MHQKFWDGTNWQSMWSSLFLYSPLHISSLTNPFCLQKEIIKGQPLRILSLSDGIATTRLALDDLGLQIADYYAYERDKRAKTIVQYHHGDKVKHIGAIEDIDYEMVRFDYNVILVSCQDVLQKKCWLIDT